MTDINPNSDLAAAFDTNALIEQLSGGDPKLMALAQLMAGQVQADEATSSPRTRQEMKVKSLRDEVRRLRRSNRALLAHSEYVAAAVGACPACWGADPECEDCAGDGTPGAYLPDRECFDEIVRPVIVTLRARLRHRRSASAGDAVDLSPTAGTESHVNGGSVPSSETH